MNAMIEPAKADIWGCLSYVSAQQLAIAQASPLPVGVTKFRQGERQLSLRYPGKLTLPPASTTSEIWIGDHVLEVTVPMSALNALVASFGHEQDMAVLSPDVQAMVLQWVLSPVMKPWELSFGGSLQILDIADYQPSTSDYDFIVDVHGFTPEPFPIVILADAKALARIPRAKSLSEYALSRAMTIDLAYMAEGFIADGDDISALCVGDGFLLPTDWRPQNVVGIKIGQSHFAEVSYQNDQLLIDAIHPLVAMKIEDQTEEENPMSDSIQHDAEIGIEVARETIPIDKLATIVTGHVLPLPSMSGQIVKLRSNGRDIATGELISTEGGYAVQITKLQ